jgi:hypothetical protein
MNYVIAPDPNDVRNGDVCIRTKKGRLVALIYARTPPKADMEVAQVVCEALNAAFSPSHTDMMVAPESLDAFLAANPLPEEPRP